MLGNSFGHLFRITTWGESHGKALGVVIDGCPSNINLNESDIQKELDRRRPGQSKVTTPRKEEDKVEILSGVFEGKTLGTPISLIIYNSDAKSGDYSNIKDLFRPGHADFTYQEKYGIRDYRGGGRQSARETVSRVAAGAVAKKVLESFEKIKITGYVKRVGDIEAKEIDFKNIEKNPVRCPDLKQAKLMESLIEKVLKDGDSIGGQCEIIIQNCPAGLGEPVFNKIKSDFASALIGINGVMSFEYGIGKGASFLKGSQCNDAYTVKNGKVKTITNNHGGILGGITSGEDIVLRISLKPTSSIRKPQNTINMNKEKATIKTEGRHDPCLLPRLVPIAEAMAALVLVDHYLIFRAYRR